MTLHIKTLLSCFHSSSKPLCKEEIKKTGEALLSLQRGLTGSRTLAGNGYMQDKNFLGAYLLYYWPSTYVQLEWILKKISCSMEFKQSVSVLDVGSGPGPASAAVCDFINEKNKNAFIDLTLFDSSEKALDLAKKIFLLDFKNVNVKVKKVNLENQKNVLESIEKNKKYDVIVMSHALNELWKEKDNAVNLRFEFLKILCENLCDEGILILNEPALLKTSRSLIALKDLLCKKNFSVVSPCCFFEENVYPCPALLSGENQTCHAAFEWNLTEPVLSLSKYAHLDREQVKMSYFVFRKNRKQKICSTFNINSENLQGVVVSDGMLNKSGRVRYLICNGKERIPVSAKKDSSYARSINFFSLKRYDKVEFKNLEVRGDSQTKAFGIKEGTTLKLLF